MSFQKDINDLLEIKLNDNTQSLPFSLYYKSDLGSDDFVNVVFESTDWIDTGIGAEDNVIVEYDGIEYNTQLGEYTLSDIRYIPCIVHSFNAEFEPYSFVKRATYSLPITFYVDEIWNKDNNDIFTEAVEEFQDSVRGLVETASGRKVLFNHSDIKPVTGLVDFNGKYFREYQMTISLDTIDSGYFGNELIYYVTHPDLNSGVTFEINPISMSSGKHSELHLFQKFNTATNNEYQTKSVPNETGFSIEVTVIYNADEFTKWLVNSKFEESKVEKLTFGVKYPEIETPFSESYVIENIGGVEMIGQLLTVTFTLRPVSEVYS